MRNKIINNGDLSKSQIREEIQAIKSELEKAKALPEEDRLRTSERLGRYQMIYMLIKQGLFKMAKLECSYLRSNYPEEIPKKRYKMLLRLVERLNNQNKEINNRNSILLDTEIQELMRNKPITISWLQKLDAHLAGNRFAKAKAMLEFSHKDFSDDIKKKLKLIVDRAATTWLEKAARRLLKDVVFAIDPLRMLDSALIRLAIVEEKYPQIRTTKYFKEQVEPLLCDPFADNFENIKKTLKNDGIEAAFALLRKYIVEIDGFRDDLRTTELLEELEEAAEQRSRDRQSSIQPQHSMEGQSEQIDHLLLEDPFGDFFL